MTLLIPAFSLRFAPPGLPLRLLRYSRTLPYHMRARASKPTSGAGGMTHIRGFGDGLEPRYILGAGTLDQ